MLEKANLIPISRRYLRLTAIYWLRHTIASLGLFLSYSCVRYGFHHNSTGIIYLFRAIVLLYHQMIDIKGFDGAAKLLGIYLCCKWAEDYDTFICINRYVCFRNQTIIYADCMNYNAVLYRNVFYIFFSIYYSPAKKLWKTFRPIVYIDWIRYSAAFLYFECN